MATNLTLTIPEKAARELLFEAVWAGVEAFDQDFFGLRMSNKRDNSQCIDVEATVNALVDQLREWEFLDD